MIWWEKHVEYKFITGAKFDFAMPLAGPAEAALSDLIFGENDKLILIEFKRNFAAINSEKDKFKVSLEDAAFAVIDKPLCHYLIYGELNNSVLELKCSTYFSRQEISPQEVFNKGVPLDDFRSYCESLMLNRAPDKRCSGMFSFSGLEQVVGVTLQGSVKVATFKEFLDKHHPHLSPAGEPAPRRPKPV